MCYQPFLIRRLRIHDTCGVNSLHGLPGILAAIASSVSAALADFKKYKTRWAELEVIISVVEINNNTNW